MLFCLLQIPSSLPKDLSSDNFPLLQDTQPPHNQRPEHNT